MHNTYFDSKHASFLAIDTYALLMLGRFSEALLLLQQMAGLIHTPYMVPIFYFHYCYLLMSFLYQNVHYDYEGICSHIRASSNLY